MVVNKEQVVEQLNKIRDQIRKGGDKEILHMNADEILCAFINSLGHKEISDAFKKAAEDFWYA